MGLPENPLIRMPTNSQPDPYFVSNVGLKSVKHKTRHGYLEITKNGCIFMDLIGENRVYYITHQGEMVRSSNFIQISCILGVTRIFQGSLDFGYFPLDSLLSKRNEGEFVLGSNETRTKLFRPISSHSDETTF